MITFDREVELFWKKKINGGAAIFLSNRYIPLITQLMYLVEYTSSIMSDKVCCGQAKMSYADPRRGHYPIP